MNAPFLVALDLEAEFGVGFPLVPEAMLGPFGVSLSGVETTFVRPVDREHDQA